MQSPYSGLAFGSDVVALLCYGSGGVDWLVELCFGDVSKHWVLHISNDGGEDLG
jgi:hypothetical protein